MSLWAGILAFVSIFGSGTTVQRIRVIVVRLRPPLKDLTEPVRWHCNPSLAKVGGMSLFWPAPDQGCEATRLSSRPERFGKELKAGLPL
jgi:hypothetical protein